MTHKQNGAQRLWYNRWLIDDRVASIAHAPLPIHLEFGAAGGLRVERGRTLVGEGWALHEVAPTKDKGLYPLRSMAATGKTNADLICRYIVRLVERLQCSGATTRTHIVWWEDLQGPGTGTHIVQKEGRQWLGASTHMAKEKKNYNCGHTAF